MKVGQKHSSGSGEWVATKCMIWLMIIHDDTLDIA